MHDLIPDVVCNICQMPAARINGRWVHAEPADEIFCRVIMRGEILTEDMSDDA